MLMSAIYSGRTDRSTCDLLYQMKRLYSISRLTVQAAGASAAQLCVCVHCNLCTIGNEIARVCLSSLFAYTGNRWFQGKIHQNHVKNFIIILPPLSVCCQANGINRENDF